MPTEQQFKELLARQAESVSEREKLATRLTDVEAKLETVNKNTAELVEMFTYAKGGFKVLGGLGNLLKWSAMVGTAIATLWGLVTGKVPFVK